MHGTKVKASLSICTIYKEKLVLAFDIVFVRLVELKSRDTLEKHRGWRGIVGAKYFEASKEKRSN